MINIATVFLILFIIPVHAASWYDSFTQWLEQEVPESASTSQQYASMRTYTATKPSAQQLEMPTAASNYVVENLAGMLNGSRSEQLEAGAYLQEAIDNGKLTPATRLLAVQHAKQLRIPRDEQINMLSELLENSDHEIQIKALRVAEKEISGSNANDICCCLTGIGLSGVATSIFGGLAGTASALSTLWWMYDPSNVALRKKITAVKASLAKEKTE